MAYNNSQYWQTIHRNLGVRLRTVGHPHLSESFNVLKYASEAESVSAALTACVAELANTPTLRVLDVGAGTGYWTRVVQDFLLSHQMDVSMTCLDVSEDALRGIKQSFPEAIPIQADLKCISPDQCRAQFDLVYSFYCLHHIPRLPDFLNALTFAARSVAPGGHLILMDPILSLPYSPFAALDFASHQGNGVPRSLHMLDDVLERETFTRVSRSPAVSFLLNGNIEAGGARTFAACSRIWRVIQRLYASRELTPRVAGLFRFLDRFCKKHHWSYSSSICVYRRQA